MSKITGEHLGRGAYVYIRQSTADQLLHNHESRRRQYGLADRARTLGWSTVEVIDDDLGRSGGGITRPGFERLIAAICAGNVGAVLAIEASRLARNGRDWHTLIEFCGLVGTIIVDEDGIYDPRHPNDRLLLGMKGTMSELELSLFRQRSQEALKQKARRGAFSRRCGRLPEVRARPDRQGPRRASAGGPAAGVLEIRRASQRPSSSYLVARGRHFAARQVAAIRGARRRLEIARLQCRPQHTD
jgi:DNA invertase Pin-like site-specific DNA recombinase